jgi:hypothetical protein
MKRYLLLLALIIFGFSTKLIGQSKIKDTLKIYQEIEGKYEFYSNLQYYYNIQLYIENGFLLFKGEDERNIQRTIPIDFDSLKFNILDSDREQLLYFLRNSNGEVSSCRLITDGSKILGNKLDVKVDTIQIANKLYSVEVLRKDLTQIKNILIQKHPAVYLFTSKDSFAKIFNEQIRKINRPMNLGEYYLIAASLVESVHCGHTWIDLPGKYWNNESCISFPVELKFTNNKAYVVRFYDNESIVPLGSEIITINKIPIAEIIKSTKGFISSDGKNETWKLERLRYSFPDLYALQYGIFNSIEIDYFSPGSKEINTQILNPVKRSSIWKKAATDVKKTSTGDPNLDLEINHSKNLSVLKIKSFGYYQEKEKFYSFIDSAFEQINNSGIHSLILDLRDNTGGDPFCTSHLLSYVESKPVPYFAKVYPYGYEHFAEPIPLATKNTFKGNLFVLINGWSFSSTGHLCSLLKYHKRCTFIGEETGGTFECNDAHAVFNTKETRLNLSVAQMTFTAAVKDISREHGILPDYYVEPQIEDIINGKDTIKEYAFKLVEKSK